MRTIQLTKGYFAIVDDEDYDRVSRYHWRAATKCRCIYAVGNAGETDPEGRKGISMHRLILNAPFNMEVNHINGNTLDNRKRNLRLCTHAQSTYNTGKFLGAYSSRFKGVYRSRAERCWRTGIEFGGRKICIGRFRIEEEAARAYDRVAQACFGEFAWLNFPDQADAATSGQTQEIAGGAIEPVHNAASLLESIARKLERHAQAIRSRSSGSNGDGDLNGDFHAQKSERF